MQKMTITLIIVLVNLLFSTINAQELSAEEIVKKANHAAYYNSDDGRAKVQMLIRDKQGRSRKRNFVMLRKDKEAQQDSEQNFYVYFNYPPDMEGMAFLVWKHMEGDDDRWMYFPALDLVKRIAGGDKRTSFVGSTFLYEDISGRRLNADKHQLLKSSEDFYLIENIPLDVQDVEFSKYIAYIDKQSFLPLKIEYYNAQGSIYRIYEVKQWDIVQGKPTILISSMNDLKTGIETFMRYRQVEYDIDLEEDIFSERYLRNAPTTLISF